MVRPHPGSAHPGECRNPDQEYRRQAWGHRFAGQASRQLHLGPGIRRDERRV